MSSSRGRDRMASVWTLGTCREREDEGDPGQQLQLPFGSGDKAVKFCQHYQQSLLERQILHVGAQTLSCQVFYPEFGCHKQDVNTGTQV